MKKILITLILFLNISISFQNNDLSIQVNQYLHAQNDKQALKQVRCPTDGGFWQWAGNAIKDIGTAIGNVARAIGDFFEGRDNDDPGESPGDESEDDDYGFDGDMFTLNLEPTPDDPNPWNDPFFPDYDWDEDEWDFIGDLPILVETYNNGSSGDPKQHLVGDLAKKVNEPETITYDKSVLPCNNSFLLPFLKIIHFTPTQLGFIKRFIFDGNNLTGFIDINNETFVNVNSVYSTGGVISSESTTYQFVAVDKIVKEIVEINAKGYQTTVTQMPDINGNNRTVIKNAPANNLNYCFVIQSTSVEDPAPGKTVEGRTVDGDPYCKELTPEDCTRAMGKKRDESYLVPGLNLKYHLNLPENIRKFLDKIYNGVMTPCAVADINSKLNTLHNSPTYLNASRERREIMERMTVGYYFIFSSLKCKTDIESVQNLSDAEKFGTGALNELINTLDVVLLTDGIAKIADGLGSSVDAHLRSFVEVADQMINDVVTTGTIDYENIFKRLIQSNLDFGSTTYETIKDICSHFQKMYFTQCGNHTFSDGTTGNICSYRHGQIGVMALPIIITGGNWTLMKAESLIGGYVNKTNTAIKYLDDATKAGANITDDANKIVINEGDELVTDISKEANEIKFKRDDNAFEPYRTDLPDVPTINGQKPRNWEFAGSTYRTKSGYDVPFNQHGFPNMEAYSERTVRIDGITGFDIRNDFAKANEAAFGVYDPDYHLNINGGQYSQYTWHHHEDAKSMMLVPKSINNPADFGVAHTGGAAIARHNNTPGAVQLNFPSPPLK